MYYFISSLGGKRKQTFQLKIRFESFRILLIAGAG